MFYRLNPIFGLSYQLRNNYFAVSFTIKEAQKVRLEISSFLQANEERTELKQKFVWPKTLIFL
jgi:hypothetical protein